MQRPLGCNRYGLTKVLVASFDVVPQKGSLARESNLFQSKSRIPEYIGDTFPLSVVFNEICDSESSFFRVWEQLFA